MERKFEKRITAFCVVVIFLLGIIAVCEIHREFVGLNLEVELINTEENEG